jgi:abortive infection bacteriophage resistance protein
LRPRGSDVYTKPALTETALLERWQQRGLLIDDRDRATRYLRHIGYYRLSAYVRSFEGKQRHYLRPGTSFDDVLGLYIFDRKLRLLVLDAVERVEVATRAAIGDHMSRSAGPHWYQDATHFARPIVHTSLLEQVDNLVAEQQSRRPEQSPNRESFVSALEHYVTTYGTPSRPPSWLVLEELSLGAVRSLYSNLARQSDKAAIAGTLGLKAPVLDSWLLTYQRVRNVCAHHGRLWNRGLGVYPAIPKSVSIVWLQDRELFSREPWRAQRLFPVIVSLQTLLHTLSPGSSWSGRLADLLDQHPSVPLTAMGFPSDWLDDPFWPRRPR